MLLGPSVQLQHRVSLLHSCQPQYCLCLVHSLRAFVHARVIGVRMSGWMKNEQQWHTDTHALLHTRTDTSWMKGACIHAACLRNEHQDNGTPLRGEDLH